MLMLRSFIMLMCSKIRDNDNALYVSKATKILNVLII